jgi:malonyl-CoA/methylmalonyl-CoA synthetase
VQARVSPEGELWIAGPSVFSGYFNRSDATEKSFVLDKATGVRWFRTGDTVEQDASSGYFRILGRTSVDILKSGGYKLSALEIEEVLREHPAVSEVAVVGLPDEIWGDRVVACVVLKKEALLAQDPSKLSPRIREFARARMAAYKAPKQIVIREELPRNAMGKVMKPDLVKLLLGTKHQT